MENNRQKKAVKEWNHSGKPSHNVTQADVALVRLLARQAAQAVFDKEKSQHSNQNDQGD